ncbi:MAG: hypothetical protein GWN31_14900 [Candidatus Thorarchaeota archaeon]|nr:hypothetical protein [Candidatus Thorarchaeota archaeon]NIW15182.1 hypothetical protein [Candidatus Thorarchaeota archaeon]NIW53171.1 hypothetical protein [Candidatus Korarchaeota archaeon]
MVKTEDGFTFVPIFPYGEWGDKDISWDSFEEMIKDLEKEEISYKVYYVE